MFLLKLLLIFSVVYGLALGRALLRIRGLLFRQPGLRYSGLDEIAPADRLVLDQPRAWLLAQGFRHCAWLQASELLRQPGQAGLTRPESFFLSRDGRIRCHVGVSPVPLHGIPYLLRFVSTLEEGTELVTVNRAGALWTPAGIEVVDAYVANDADQLALHRARMGDRPCRAFADFDELLGHANQVGAALFDAWRAEWLQRKGEDWRLRWRGAWHFLRLVQRHQRRVAQTPPPSAAGEAGATAALASPAAVPEAGAPAAPGGALPPAGDGAAAALHHAEAAMLAQQLDLESAHAGKGKTGVFLLTGIGFLVLGKLFFGGGWGFIAALMVVLLVHELGHYAAMRAFGYRDLSIFFLPLLGAAAQGRKDNAPPWQQLVILLAGPVPGLVLAVAGLAWFFAMGPVAGAGVLPGWLMGFGIDLIVISLIVNAINLLPVQPLDGGRVAELLFFSRFPRASFAFFVAGVGVLAAFAVGFEDPVLGFLALVLALSLRAQWRLATVSRALRPHFGAAAARGQALALLAQAFNSGAGKTWPPVARLNIARALLPRLQGGLPGRATLVLGSAVYLGLLASPLLLLPVLGPGALTSPLQAFTSLAGSGLAAGGQQRMEERLARAQTPDEKMRAHLALYYLYKHPAPGQAQTAEAAAQSAAKAREHLEAAWRLLPPENPMAAGHAAHSVMTAYVQDLAERDAGAAMALHETLLKTLQAGGRVADQARWLQFKDLLLAGRKAPLSARIANREQEVALWEAQAGPAITGGVTTAAVVMAARQAAAPATPAAAPAATAATPATAASGNAVATAPAIATAAKSPATTTTAANTTAANTATAADAMAAAEATAAAALPTRISPDVNQAEHEARSGLLLARRMLALLHRQDGHPDIALALLRLNLEQAARMPAGDDYRYLRDSSLTDLAWALVEAGRSAEVAPLFAGFQPLPQPFDDYESDAWEYTLPEQAQAWAALQAGDTATALSVFGRLQSEARRADPQSANTLLAIALDLDLLLAQQRAGDAAAIAATQQHLQQVAKQLGDERWLAGAIDMAQDSDWNLAAARVRAHRDLLRTLGFKLETGEEKAAPKAGAAAPTPNTAAR